MSGAGTDKGYAASLCLARNMTYQFELVKPLVGT